MEEHLYRLRQIQRFPIYDSERIVCWDFFEQSGMNKKFEKQYKYWRDEKGFYMLASENSSKRSGPNNPLQIFNLKDNRDFRVILILEKINYRDAHSITNENDIQKFISTYGQSIYDAAKQSKKFDIFEFEDAFKKKDYETIELAINNGLDINSKIGIAGETLLHCYVMENDLESVKELIKLGADVNIKSNSGVSPLSTAMTKGNNEMYVELVLGGADRLDY
ncbi:ankyrin repeat domain-containing protein [Bacillus sp. AFS073361]|uniref:ankyrin repeat domain-containing protein n=1 Tax=Bacillus sp. AFS073361 TaxID=2033511 RepID=UPI0015D4EC66|nr:ankyrin repeat domain-containing protein [Bacillus sp. AFS073361]